MRDRRRRNAAPSCPRDERNPNDSSADPSRLDFVRRRGQPPKAAVARTALNGGSACPRLCVLSASVASFGLDDVRLKPDATSVYAFRKIPRRRINSQRTYITARNAIEKASDAFFGDPIHAKPRS
jgi:hypothetical protein